MPVKDNDGWGYLFRRMPFLIRGKVYPGEKKSHYILTDQSLHEQDENRQNTNWQIFPDDASDT